MIGAYPNARVLRVDLSELVRRHDVPSAVLDAVSKRKKAVVPDWPLRTSVRVRPEAFRYG